MLRLWLIRHGQTPGNKLQRYIGVTDEPLSPEGIAYLQTLSYPKPEMVFVSPMRRCVQTAGILFPDQKLQIIDKLSECDFGEFENKNYLELGDNPAYQAWVDSGGRLPFPGGESREEFKHRSILGFQTAVRTCLRKRSQTAALVIHGGTIMNLMEEYCEEKRAFYEWAVSNGNGYLVEIEESLWEQGKRSMRLLEKFN